MMREEAFGHRSKGGNAASGSELLIPADETPLETAIGLEQMVVDLTADLAQGKRMIISRHWTLRCWRTSTTCSASP